MPADLFSRPLVAAAALAYFAAVVGIGVWSLSRTRDRRDFWVAGQALGVVVAGLSTMAAAFSGFVFLGGPGLTYRLGATAFFINLPVGFTAGLLGWTVAKRLRLLAEVREVYTVPDAVLCRYGSRSAAGMAAVAVLVGTVGYLGAQFLALGALFESALGLERLAGERSFALAVGIGALVILFYNVAGGMIAGVWADVLQGALMLAAAVGVFAWALLSAGGPAAIAASIAGSERFGPRFLEPFGGAPVATAFGFFFVFGVGVLGQPHMLHKFYMLRHPADLRWFPLVLGGSQVVALLVWLGVGLAVPALVAQGRLAPLERPDDATPLFLLGFTPEPLAGLAIAAALSAIVSTTFPTIGAAALVRDLPRAFGRAPLDSLAWGRAATAAVTLAAAGLALATDDLIALLGTFAFGTFGAALAPALAVGLNWRRVTASAATASMATGALGNVALELAARRGLDLLPAGVLPSAVAMAASFTVLFLVTLWTGWWTGRPEGEPLPPDVAAVMEM